MENNELELARQRDAEMKERMKYDCTLLVCHAYELIDIIKEADIKDEIIDIIKTFTKAQKERNSILQEIKTSMEKKKIEFTEENMSNYFKNNPALHKKYMESNMDDIQLDLIDKVANLIIINIPKCRNNINSLIGSIYKKDGKDIDLLPIDEFTGMIMGIGTSSSFPAIFKMIKLFFR